MKSNHFNQRKGFTSKLSLVRFRLYERKEGCMYCYYYYLYLPVNTNVQLQVQSVKSRPFITLPKYIPQENQCGSEQRKRKQAENQEDFISYR